MPTHCSQVLWACAHLASQRVFSCRPSQAPCWVERARMPLRQGEEPSSSSATHPRPPELPLSRKTPPHKQQQTRARAGADPRQRQRWWLRLLGGPCGTRLLRVICVCSLPPAAKGRHCLGKQGCDGAGLRVGTEP